MERLSVRLTDRTFRQLDALALERGVTRTQLVRQLLEAGLRDRPEPPSETPSEEELLELLAEKARIGNVAAIRTLLVREEQRDPRAQALALFEANGGEAAVSALLYNALRALGPGPTRREVAQVAAALRESGDGEVGPLLNYEENPELWDRCCAIADDAGAYGFVALDLAVAFHNPEWFAGLVRGEDEHL
jgi:Ribbon-helix-helix protein, copG family